MKAQEHSYLSVLLFYLWKRNLVRAENNLYVCLYVCHYPTILIILKTSSILSPTTWSKQVNKLVREKINDSFSKPVFYIINTKLLSPTLSQSTQTCKFSFYVCMYLMNKTYTF